MQSSVDAAMMTPVMIAYPLSQAAMMSPVNTFPSTSTVSTSPWYNPVMYQTVAYPNNTLPNMMMPQQQQYQYSNPNVYGNSY